MLVITDWETHQYFVALNEATSITELIADLSYLHDLPCGRLVFDFTHTASNLTRAVALEHIPGQFGFHPLDRIIGQLSFIGRLVEMPLLACCSHNVSVVLPASSSKLGQFLSKLGVFDLMTRWRIPVETRGIWELEGARDDVTRRVLIPLTDILVNSKGLPDAIQMTEIRDRISNGLFETLDIVDAPTQLPEMIGGIVESISSLVRGGLLASLYFPTTGYLEASVMNRAEGAMGAEPNEQLDALVDRIETASSAFEKVLDGVTRCYGTVQFFNGFASVFVSPDGSFTTRVERIGLPSASVPGPQVTVVLQLPPKAAILWEPFTRKRVEAIWSTMLN
jgi:hypothetical protein